MTKVWSQSKRLQRRLVRRRTGPQQYTTKEGAKKRKDEA